jgi:hypothetical protein
MVPSAAAFLARQASRALYELSIRACSLPSLEV